MTASWQESYDKPRQCIEKQSITLQTKVHIVKAKVFPVVRYSCESWTIKKTECQRIDLFEFVVLEKIPESPLESKEIKPINLKENQP